jgi:hypothetical protein
MYKYVSFISENTTDGINCVEYYDNCRAEYQYMNNDTSVIVTKALRNLECHGLVMGYYCKFFYNFCVTS